LLYGASVIGGFGSGPNLTSHEAAREAFTASFTGQAFFGPGRTTDEASQAYFIGTMTSSAFFHGRFQMDFFVPNDPTQPVTGQAALSDRNISNSGNQLIVDLTSTAPAGQAPQPTQWTWTVNGASGGTFANATGQGTARVFYRHLTRPDAHGTSSGVATVLFRGLVNTTGINNVLKNRA
jgi:hypothetical protein